MALNNNTLMNNNNKILQQSIKHRRTVYRELLNKAQDIQEADETGRQTIVELNNILKCANTLNDEIPIDQRCQHSDETLLDCEVVSIVSETLKKCTNAADVDICPYDPNEFVAKLISDINQETGPSLMFQKLINQAKKIIPSIPTYSCVFGCSEENQLVVIKERKDRQKVVKETLKKVVPMTVHNREREEERIEDIVKALFDILCKAYKDNGERPLDYYEYVIDTESYTNTIENMFYFAFLIKDGRASIDLDADNNSIIEPMHSIDVKQFKDNSGENVQIVSSINMSTWRRFQDEGLIQKYKKRKP